MSTETDRIYRDKVRYTGDGLPGAPAGAFLPQGDPSSGEHNPKKSEIRALLNSFEVPTVAAHGMPTFTSTAELALATVPTSVLVVGGVIFQENATGAYADAVGKKFAPAWFVTPRMFGAHGDDATDDRTPILSAFVYGAAHKIPVIMEGLTYRSSEATYTDSDLCVLGRGAVIKYTAWPAVGGFFTNVWSSGETADAPTRRLQSNIYVEGLTLSGELLPAPSSEQNSNLFGFARGMNGAVVRDCVAKKMRDGFGGGSGGAGFGDELGAQNILWDNCRAEDCFRGMRVNANSETFADTGAAKKHLRNIVFRNYTALRCGTAIFGHAIAAPAGDWDASNLAIYDVVVDGYNFIDCGHYPWRQYIFADNPGISPEKTAVVCFSGAENIYMTRGRIVNATSYNTFTDWLGNVGYPGAGTNFIGAGLSGAVGAVIRGWGRDIVIDGLQIDGYYDYFWFIGRNITFGDLGSIAPISNTHGIRMSNIKHVAGSLGYIFGSMSGVDDAEVAANIGPLTIHAAPSIAISDANSAAFTGVILEFQSRAGNFHRGSLLDFMSKSLSATGVAAFTIAGSFATGGGYSASGARAGQTFDASIGFERSSQTGSGTKTMQAFYRTAGLVGSISTTDTTTVYATTSDARLKCDPCDFDASALIDSLRVYDHAWINGGRAFGVFAQEAHQVLPGIVLEGDSEIEWEEKSAEDRIPWAVDYTKLVPVILRALQQSQERLLALEKKLVELS